MSDAFNSPPGTPLAAAVAKLVSGDGTPEELAHLRMWIAGEPGGAEWLELFERAAGEIRQLRHTVDIPALQARVYQEIAARGSATGPAERRQGVPPFRSTSRLVGGGTAPFARFQRLGMAVVAATVLVVGMVVIHDHRQATNTTVAAPRIYRTANAQRATVTLTDGSTVLLGDASRLEVPADFGSGNRTVMLIGEGYFTAAHNTGAPLTVISGNVATRVLGTEFSVRKYADDGVARVFVSTGKVSVSATHPAEPNRRADTVLTANMLAQLSDSGDITVTSNVSRNSVLGWITGRLVLTDAPIAEAISEIERHYDLEISLDDPALGVGDISAVFGDEPVSRVLDDLALALGARYTRSGPDGRIVTFLPSRGGIHRVPPSRTQTTITPEKRYGS